MGEICWGFHVAIFEEEIEEKKEIVEKFLMRLVNEEKLGVIETYLNSSEVDIIKKALKVVEKELEAWESSTRIGASLEEVKKQILIFNDE